MENLKLETQTSFDSNNDNTNAEVTKLTSNPISATLTISEQLNSDAKTPTPTPVNFGSNDTSFMFITASSKLTYKPLNGNKIRKPGANYVFKQENIKTYTDAHGIVYNVNGKFILKID
jgi:hypothetical protein